MIPCIDKTDVIIFVVCICPLSTLAYTCCYQMLKHTHTDTTGYAAFILYGFIQFILGCITGYCTSRWIRHTHTTPITQEQDPAEMEEIPLLPTSTPPHELNHSFDGIAKASGA